MASRKRAQTLTSFENKRARSDKHKVEPTRSGSDITPNASIIQDETDLALYERAIQFFIAGRFQEAKELFATLLNIPNRDLAYTAELRIRMCDQRLARSKANEQQ